jgi:hypothetical protein
VVATMGAEAMINESRSAADRFPNSLSYDVDDEVRCGYDWSVVYRMRLHTGVHPLSYKRCVSCAIMRSCSAMRTQVGRSFQWTIHGHRDAC